MFSSYEVEHVWYVLKSQVVTYLGPALRRALHPPSGHGAPGLSFKAEGRRVVAPLSSVLYIGREQRRTLVVCVDQTYRASALPAALITPAIVETFVRCHQSYWVNLGQVVMLDRDSFLLTGGTRIPIGRTYRAEARRRFFEELRK